MVWLVFGGMALLVLLQFVRAALRFHELHEKHPELSYRNNEKQEPKKGFYPYRPTRRVAAILLGAGVACFVLCFFLKADGVLPPVEQNFMKLGILAPCLILVGVAGLFNPEIPWWWDERTPGLTTAKVFCLSGLVFAGALFGIVWFLM